MSDIRPSKYGLDGLSSIQRADLQANIVSTLQCGCFAGALIASYVADRLGRRKALLIAAVVVTIGCIFQAAADGHIALMYVGRLIAEFGVGKASMVTPLYISENAPRAIRGGLTGIYQLFIATGTMLAFWVCPSKSNNLNLDLLTICFDQLRCEQALDRIDNLHCASDYAGSSGNLALRLNVLLQGVA